MHRQFFEGPRLRRGGSQQDYELAGAQRPADTGVEQGVAGDDRVDVPEDPGADHRIAVRVAAAVRVREQHERRGPAAIGDGDGDSQAGRQLHGRGQHRRVAGGRRGGVRVDADAEAPGAGPVAERASVRAEAAQRQGADDDPPEPVRAQTGLQADHVPDAAGPGAGGREAALEGDLPAELRGPDGLEERQVCDGGEGGDDAEHADKELRGGGVGADPVAEPGLPQRHEPHPLVDRQDLRQVQGADQRGARDADAARGTVLPAHDRVQLLQREGLRPGSSLRGAPAHRGPHIYFHTYTSFYIVGT